MIRKLFKKIQWNKFEVHVSILDEREGYWSWYSDVWVKIYLPSLPSIDERLILPETIKKDLTKKLFNYYSSGNSLCEYENLSLTSVDVDVSDSNFVDGVLFYPEEKRIDIILKRWYYEQI